MIDIDVHKDWGSFTLDVKLHHEGGILGLLGASGCGKSKTLQCIAGIEKPDAGKVVVGARTLFDSGRRINVPVPQRRVGYLFQHYALFPNMPVDIAAKAANDIFPARDSGESFADLHQKAVAARMAEPIVNGFETIEIDKNKRDLLLLGAGGGKA